VHVCADRGCQNGSVLVPSLTERKVDRLTGDLYRVYVGLSMQCRGSPLAFKMSTSSPTRSWTQAPI